MRAFVSEYGAVDSDLAAIVFELPPNKHGITGGCSEDNLLAWADAKLALPSVAISVGAVVPLVEGEACGIAVLCEPPQRRAKGSPIYFPPVGVGWVGPPVFSVASSE